MKSYQYRKEGILPLIIILVNAIEHLETLPNRRYPIVNFFCREAILKANNLLEPNDFLKNQTFPPLFSQETSTYSSTNALPNINPFTLIYFDSHELLTQTNTRHMQDKTN